jgi:hypothetical protein
MARKKKRQKGRWPDSFRNQRYVEPFNQAKPVQVGRLCEFPSCEKEATTRVMLRMRAKNGHPEQRDLCDAHVALRRTTGELRQVVVRYVDRGLMRALARAQGQQPAPMTPPVEVHKPITFDPLFLRKWDDGKIEWVGDVPVNVR